MHPPLYLIFSILLHALFLLQPVLSLPTALVRRISATDFEPQGYIQANGQRYFDGPTFFAKEWLPQGQHFSNQQIDAKAHEAYTLICQNRAAVRMPLPEHLILAALHVPGKNAIYYATQPLGAGWRYYMTIRLNPGWPGLLSQQSSMHAEGHAIYRAIKDEATAHFRGSYMGVYGRFNRGLGQKIPPCQGGRNPTTNCAALLTGYHIKF